jgi:2-polyprenyl-6-methoxyphenol hydroxylase-like FAD-dependent oxidoreductase
MIEFQLLLRITPWKENTMDSQSGIGDLQRDKQRNNGGGKRQRDRAIVMGGSMAGLAAARVLSDHYGEVIIVEREVFGPVGEHRRGVPQGRHAHGLLPSGLSALEDLFPGLTREAIDAGALRMDLMRDSRWFFEGGEHARFESGLDGLLISRPLLEGLVRERVRRLTNVDFRQGCQVMGLLTH